MTKPTTLSAIYGPPPGQAVHQGRWKEEDGVRTEAGPGRCRGGRVWGGEFGIGATMVPLVHVYFDTQQLYTVQFTTTS